MTRVLVTGGSGFIGSHLIPRLSGYHVRIGTRKGSAASTGTECELANYDVDDLKQDYELLLKDIDIVVHLAGIAHTRHVSPDRHQCVNAQGTARLVAAAVSSNIKRFIFLSTIKVHGECTAVSGAVTENSQTLPQDDYSISKLEAEKAIISACNGSRTEYVILRPPLVYGPGVRANFFNLLRLVANRLPLPFSAIENRRSFIYVENLVDLIRTCIDHPAAGNHIFVLKDYDDSTPELVTKLSQAFGASPRLFPLPVGLLIFLARLTCQGQTVRRLTESLLVDDSSLRNLLGWHPYMDQKTAFVKTVNWYKALNQRGQP